MSGWPVNPSRFLLGNFSFHALEEMAKTLVGAFNCPSRSQNNPPMLWAKETGTVFT
jgi:hypothetical protein